MLETLLSILQCDFLHVWARPYATVMCIFLHPSYGFYHITQIFGAQLEAAIELRQSKGVDWHYFCTLYTEFRGRTFSRVGSELNDFFSAQFILRSIHKWLKLFSDTFLTISNAKKNPLKKIVDFGCPALY
jgi:hypothetical protein